MWNRGGLEVLEVDQKWISRTGVGLGSTGRRLEVDQKYSEQNKSGLEMLELDQMWIRSTGIGIKCGIEVDKK